MAKSVSAEHYTVAQAAVIDSIAAWERDEESKKFWNSTPRLAQDEEHTRMQEFLAEFRQIQREHELICPE